jgi:predicted Fe-Mo cluster-binding NifX family protein
MRIAIPTTGKRKLSNKVADTFSRAPSFTIVTLEGTKIKGIEVVDNPGAAMDKGAGPIAARTIKEQDVDILISGELGPGARNILEALDIKVYPAQIGKKVNETIENWVKLGL